MSDHPTSDENFVSRSVAETESVAARIAARLSAGGVVALVGELGAGKTQFVRGLVRALGGGVRQVHSPTFVLLHEYVCRDRTLFHVDAYRVGAADLEAIGFEEILAAAREGSVLAIEWADKIRELLPPETIRVHIMFTSPTTREIIVQPAAA